MKGFGGPRVLESTDVTDSEIEAEKEYRFQERLGILCGDAEATREQMEIAHNESNDWEFHFLIENQVMHG